MITARFTVPNNCWIPIARRGARIYDNLGFEQRGAVEATSSLQLDPTNFSAHRFLSDTYVNQPGRETAQLSELLQAKMLQPININPVQPHLSVAQRGLLNASGIANSSFQDFTRVFEGNRPQLLVSGVAGNQGILGDEATLSGIVDKFSYSLGQYHYQTDGFTRPYGLEENKKNTDQKHNIYDAFLQWAITDRLNTQFEFVRRETELGSIRQHIDDTTGDNYTERDSLMENTYRGGINLRVFSDDYLLFSYIHTDSFTVIGPLPSSSFLRTDTNFALDFYEIQYNLHRSLWNGISGFNSYSTRTSSESQLAGPSNNHRSGYHAYSYLNLKLPKRVISTIGFSYDYSDNKSAPQQFPKRGVYPKVGLMWDLSKDTKFRFAYFRGYKRPIDSFQTIEPTQVAGFNQFFDDHPDRYFSFYGTALDLILRSNFLTGIEFSRRDVVSGGQLFLEKDLFNVYVNWMPSEDFSILTRYKFVKDTMPQVSQVSTHFMLLEGRYFDPSGLFGKITGTYVNQTKITEKSPISNRSGFFLLDASIGFRFPKRFGIIALEGKNLLNKRYRFEDPSTNENNLFYNASEFIPQRTIFGRITLNF